MAFTALSTLDSSIADVAGYVNSKAMALVRPQTSPGIEGFVFDIPETETVMLESEITDNFTESNEFINDHRIIKPVKIELTGLIGELIITQEQVDAVFRELSTGLTVIDAYLGSFTNGMTQNIARGLSTASRAQRRVRQVVDRVKNITAALKDEGDVRTRQQQAFSDLEGMFKSNSILTVQTPWKYYDNMMIETIEFRQDSITQEITNVLVTLKEVRFAKIGVEDLSDLTPEENRYQLQSEGGKNLGEAGKETPAELESIASRAGKKVTEKGGNIIKVVNDIMKGFQ